MPPQNSDTIDRLKQHLEVLRAQGGGRTAELSKVEHLLIRLQAEDAVTASDEWRRRAGRSKPPPGFVITHSGGRFGYRPPGATQTLVWKDSPAHAVRAAWEHHDLQGGEPFEVVDTDELNFATDTTDAPLQRALVSVAVAACGRDRRASIDEKDLLRVMVLEGTPRRRCVLKQLVLLGFLEPDPEAAPDHPAYFWRGASPHQDTI